MFVCLFVYIVCLRFLLSGNSGQPGADQEGSLSWFVAHSAAPAVK